MNSIRSMLLLGLAFIAILFFAQAFLLAGGQKRIENNVVNVVQRNTIASAKLSDVALLAQQVRRYEKEYFVYVSNAERRNNYIKEWSGTHAKLTQQLQGLRANESNALAADEVGKVANWASANDFYGAEMKKIFALVDERETVISAQAKNTTAVAASALKGAAPAATPAAVLPTPIEVNGMISAGKDRLSSVLIKGVSEMSAEKTKATLALPEVTRSEFGALWNSVMASVLLGLVAAGALAFLLPRAVTAPVAMLSAAVDRVSRGEIDQAISVAMPKEFETLGAAVERMRIAQRTLVSRLRSK